MKRILFVLVLSLAAFAAILSYGKRSCAPSCPCGCAVTGECGCGK